jgi:hypothetical protein
LDTFPRYSTSVLRRMDAFLLIAFWRTARGLFGVCWEAFTLKLSDRAWSAIKTFVAHK